MKWLLLLTALLLAGCGGSDLTGGPGGQTTNGIVASVNGSDSITVRLRPRSYRQGSPLEDDTLTAVNSVTRRAERSFQINNILPGSYLLECLNAELSGVVDSLTIRDDSTLLTLDSLTLQPLGAFTGHISQEFLDEYDSVTIAIEGLDHPITLVDTSFTAEHLSPWDYTLAVTGFHGDDTMSTTATARVTAEDTIDLGNIEAPRFRALRSLLDSVGLPDVHVHDVAKFKSDTTLLLDLRSRGLTALPSDLTPFSFITELILDSNRLSTLPATIGEFTKLRHLSINHNKILSLPSELTWCSALLTLEATDNYLEEIPAAINGLKKLRVLQLDRNAITAIPEALSVNGPAFLVNLTLSSNNITMVPESMRTGFVNLLEMNLHYNKIDTTTLSTELIQWINGRSGGNHWIDTQR